MRGIPVKLLLLAMTLFGSACGTSGNSLSMASDIQVGGFVASDIRAFPAAPVQEGQSGVDIAPSLIVEPELMYQWNDGADTVTLVGHIQRESGSYDPERNHADIRELNWSHTGDRWFMQAGIAKVFWGKVESRRLVDIINQRDLVENVDPDDKLGQPLLNVGFLRDWGTAQIYIMPYFREGTFPSRAGRLRGPYPVDTDRTIYESRAKERHVDVAVRYTTVIDNWDLGISHFHGTGREPRVTLGTDDQGRYVLIPNYDIIDQTSIDLQATYDNWLLKLEAYYRSGNASPFFAAVGGFEYTFYGITESGSDLGVLVEYLYDGRDVLAPPTSIDDELFLAVRWVANDEDDTDLLAGVLMDVNTGSQSFSARYRTRVDDHIALTVEGAAFAGISPTEDVLYAARKDHNLWVRLAYYF